MVAGQAALAVTVVVRGLEALAVVEVGLDATRVMMLVPSDRNAPTSIASRFFFHSRQGIVCGMKSHAMP